MKKFKCNDPFPLWEIFFYSALALILFKSWGLSRPFLTFGDESIYYQIEASFRDILISSRETLGHPPLYALIVKIVQAVAGQKAILSLRALSLFVYALFGHFFFKVAKELFSSLESCLLSLSLLSTPLFWGRSHLIVPNLLVALFLFASLHLYLKQRNQKASIPIYFAFLCRESALAFGSVFVIWEKARERKKSLLILLGLFSYYLIRNIIGHDKLFYGPAQLDNQYQGLLSFLRIDRLWLNTLAQILLDIFNTEKGILHYLLILLLLDRILYRCTIKNLPLRKRATLQIIHYALILILLGIILYRWEWHNYLKLLFSTYTTYGSFPSGHYALWQGVLYSALFFLFLGIKKKSRILLSVKEKKVLCTGLFISFAYITFFSIYRDYYDRDIMTFYPLYFLTLYILVRVFIRRKHWLLLPLLISLVMNIVMFTSSDIGFYQTEKSIERTIEQIKVP